MAFRPGDFMPAWDKPPQTPETIEALMMDWAKRHNRIQRRKRKRT